MGRLALSALILAITVGCASEDPGADRIVAESSTQDLESKISDLEYQVSDLEDKVEELESKLSEASDQAQVVHSAIEQADAQMGMFYSMDWADVVPMVRNDIMEAQSESENLLLILD